MAFKKYLTSLVGIIASIAILSFGIATVNGSDMTSPAFSVATETQEKPFSDVPTNHWAYENILYLWSTETMQGYNDGTFKPEREITRAEFLKTVLSVFLKDAVTEGPFTDLDEWQKPWVHTAYNLGIVKGYTETEFKPNQPITRAEAVKILVEAYNLIKNPFNRIENNFEDLDIENWAYDYIDIATDMHIISGYNENGKTLFKPKKNLNRAEAATIVTRSQLQRETYDPYYQMISQVKLRPEVNEWLNLLESTPNSGEAKFEILETYTEDQFLYNIHVYEEFSDHNATFNYYEVDLSNGEITPTLPVF